MTIEAVTEAAVYPVHLFRILRTVSRDPLAVHSEFVIEGEMQNQFAVEAASVAADMVTHSLAVERVISVDVVDVPDAVCLSEFESHIDQIPVFPGYYPGYVDTSDIPWQ